MKKLIFILLLFITCFTYAQITTIKVQGSGGSGSVGTLQQVFNTESGGSILTKLDTINWSTTGIRVLGAGALTLNTGGITALAGLISATNSGSTAIAGSSTSSTGVQGSSTNLFGVNAVSTNSYGLHVITSSATTTVAAANFERSTAVTNTILPLIQIQRSTSGTAANGIGTSFEFMTEVSDGQNLISNTLESVWDNATVGARTSVLNIRGINSTASEVYAKFKTGSLVIVGNGADTLATLEDVRAGGGGAGNTIYTGDGTLAGNRTVDLDGNSLTFSDGTMFLSMSSPSVAAQTAGGKYFGIDDGDDLASLKYDNSNKIGINGTGTTVTGNINYITPPTGASTDSILTWDAATNTVNKRTLGSFNIGSVTSVAALTLGTTGTDLSSSVANGTTTPVITLNVPTASASNRGALSAADWSTFNGKAPLTSPTFITDISTPLALITGTGGGGYVQIANQSSTPSTPTTSGRIFFDNTNRLSWIGTNGFVRTFDGTANTANRTYTLPDSSGTVALMIDSPQHVFDSTKVAFTAGVAPTVTNGLSYQWTRVGHMVTVRINLAYSVTGTTISAVTLAWPTDLPLPADPLGAFTGNTVKYIGIGSAGTVLTGNPSAFRASIKQTGGLPTFLMSVTSGTYQYFFVNATYWTP